MAPPILVWLRRDLRLDDHPALAEAAGMDEPVVPIYIHDPEAEAPWQPGGASKWWLHHSLAALDTVLRQRGSRLIVRKGPSLEVLMELRQETGARAVFWNRLYEPAAITRDSVVKRAWREAGGEARSFNGALLFEPTGVLNQQGKPFQVFTPYWRHVQRLRVEAPVPMPAGPLVAPATWPRSLLPADLNLLPRIPWDVEFPAHWRPGEAGAWVQLRKFTEAAVDEYGRERDRPDREGVSRLSPHLHWGEVGPRRLWAEVRARGGSPGAEAYLRELGWREFAHALLYHFPQTPELPLRLQYAAFPWEPDERLLEAWRRGRTGYPIVDAGMRQLWRTGWMHNRVRMIVASFLVKHLLQPWNAGAAWFWDTLVDADLAANTLGWQWSAGCGADAAPYFRIFNPVLQGLKFDPDGDYVRRWVPELERVPVPLVHQPWEGGPSDLADAGVRLGETYPRPVIAHAAGRARALAALARLPKAG